MKTFVTVSLFAIVLGYPLQTWSAPLAASDVAIGLAMSKQLFRRSSMDHSFFDSGANDGVDDHSDISIMSDSDASIGSYSSHGQFDSDDEVPIPTTPAEFYDPGYANAIRTQFAAQPNIHQLVDDLIAAYEAVEVPGVFPVAHYLQAILQASLWNTVGTASTKTVANSHALVLMRVIRLLISQAQEIDDGAAVRFLEQAHWVLRVVSQNFVQRQMDTLPGLYARRSATVAPADFLRGYIRQVGLGDGPTDNEALIQLADSLGGGTISPIHVVQFMNNIYARRGQELFENFQTPPAAHQ